MSNTPKKRVPWLNTLYVSDELRLKLDRAWASYSTAWGSKIPQAMFVRKLLEAGMDHLAETDK